MYDRAVERPREQIRLERERCPFCREAVRPDEAKTACDACMAWHHTECWGEHGGCAACDHAGAVAPGAPRRAREGAGAEPAPAASAEGAAECRRIGCAEPVLAGKVLCTRHALQDAYTLLVTGPLAVAVGAFLFYGAGAALPAIIVGGVGVLNVGMGLMRLADTWHARRAARTGPGSGSGEEEEGKVG